MGNTENKKLILDVKIDMNGPAYQLKGKNCEVTMIPWGRYRYRESAAHSIL